MTMWAGLPVLTRMDESFAVRVVCSMLNAIGLPELIAHTEAEYQALVIQLAGQHEQLNAIKTSLQHNQLITPLLDTERYAAHLDAAYEQLYER